MKENSKPFISIVITGLNEEKNIERCLKSALTQRYAKYEVIYVDGGSTDRTLSIVERIAMHYKNRLKVVVAHGSTPAEARNLGISISKGDIIAFLDADCKAPPSWIRKIASKLVNADHTIAGIGGPYIIPEEYPWKVHAIFDTLNTLLGGNFLVQFARLKEPQIAYALPAGNSAYWKDDLLSVGGFDRRLRYCEDHLLGIKLSERGKCVLYDSELYVYHYCKVYGLLSFLKLMLRYGKGRADAFFADRRLFSFVRIVPALSILAFVALVVLFLLTESPLVRSVLITCSISYFTALTANTLRLILSNKDLRYAISFIVYLTEHIAYGVGMLIGVAQNTLAKLLGTLH